MLEAMLTVAPEQYVIDDEIIGMSCKVLEGIPPSDLELREKFHRLSCQQLPGERAAELEKVVWHCEELHDINRLLSLIALPVSTQ